MDATAAADVLAVIQAAFGARPVLDPPADALAETRETVGAALEACPGLLVTLDGRPVGACLLTPTPDGLVLRRFGVLPDLQGTGVAGAMVEAAAVAAVGYPALLITAREELPRTVGFWRSMGFDSVSQDGAFISMRRDLPTSWVVEDADAMRALGERIGRALVAGDLVVLTGELGAGKTTFTQGLAEGLGVRGGVTSPTFVISRVHPSLGSGPDLVHVDAYRLSGSAELDDLDLDTSFDEAVTVVEWGEGLAEVLAESRIEVVIQRALADESAGGLDPRRVAIRRHPSVVE